MRLNRLTSLFTKALELGRREGDLHSIQEQILGQQNYKPTAFLTHPFLQSIYNLAEPKIQLELYKERVFFDDGGHISLNWVTKPQQNSFQQSLEFISENSQSSLARKKKYEKNIVNQQYSSLFKGFENQLEAKKNKKLIDAQQTHKNLSLKKAPPILFLMHGLTGGSQNNYVKALMMEAATQGYMAVCMNSRGIDDQMTSPIPFTGVSHFQLEEGLKRVRMHYPDSDIYLVGTSFGGNYLIRYLLKSYEASRKGQSETRLKNIKGLVVLAPPFSVTDCVDDMKHIYQGFFVRRYIQETINKHPLMNYWHDIGLIDIDRARKAQSLREFHSEVTAKILGFSGADQVFDHLNVKKHLIKDVNIPTLIMTSKDDPIVSYRSFPLQEIESNKNISFVATQRGGHMCWFQGMLPKRWYPKPTLNFFRKIQNSDCINYKDQQLCQ